MGIPTAILAPKRPFRLIVLDGRFAASHLLDASRPSPPRPWLAVDGRYWRISTTLPPAAAAAEISPVVESIEAKP